MTFRTAYGLTHSENGWRMCNRDECAIVSIPGLYLVDTAPLRTGAPLTILGAWLRWYDTNVEEIGTPVWGWSAENQVKTSNHLSGTAVDLCAPKYPWGVSAAKNMPASRIAKIREGLKLFEGSVFWGEDWSYKDPMHYQMAWREGDPRNEAFAAKLRGGYLGIYKASTPAPTPTSGLTAAVLAQAMGNSAGVDYAQLLPGYVGAMKAANINTPLRAAHFAAQIGHESGGLRWMEEIADGSAYEGRADLGNTQPGDGRKFKGGGPVQLTGRANYTAFSAWAHAKGYAPTVTYYVDRPELVRSDPAVGFLATAWYWSFARPQLNALADADDVVGVTRAVNGGTNGLDDRRTRLARCKTLGAALLPANAEEDFMPALTDAEQKELLAKTRVIHDQLGPNLWGPDSSLGETGDGKELTLRDGLARLVRVVDAIAGKLGL